MPEESEAARPLDPAETPPSEPVPAPEERWWRRRLGVLTAGLLLVVLVAPPSLDAWVSSGKVVGRVRAGGIVVSHLERRGLEEALARRGRELLERRLAVRVGGKQFALEPRAVGFAVDVRASADRTFAVGRQGNLLVRAVGFWKRLFVAERVELAVRVPSSELTKLLVRWEDEAGVHRPFPGGIRVDGVSVQVLPPGPGARLTGEPDESALRAALVADEPRELVLSPTSVPAPLPREAAERVARDARSVLSGTIVLVSSDPEARVTLTPSELAPALRAEPNQGALVLAFARDKLEGALAATRGAIERDALDAKFEIDDKNVVTVTPSRPGLRLDFARLGTAITAAAARVDRTFELPLLREPQPALTTEEAGRLGVRGLVSSFTTRHPCCERRVDNIHRIADILNGKVVRPGETVSVNELVGPRTAKNGFVPAPTIEEGEFVDSIGGGISQFATTLFNALFHGGYEIIERQPHSYWFPRYPMGHEATLSWPKPDIIFRNDTAAGMVFETSYTGTSVTVKIYGDNGGRKVRAQVSGRQNVIEPVVELLPNARVSPDEEHVKEPGSVGWSVIVSRFLTFPDGTTKEERRRVTYKPRPKRVEVHPCRIPKGDKGYTGERCPEPEDVEKVE